MRLGDAPALPWSPEAFEARYRANPDPWSVRDSTYEQERFRTTLRWLSRDRYRRGLEPGCAIGELTAQLAARCDHLVAFDVAPSALCSAETRCRSATGTVELRKDDLASFRPRGDFDLVVLSEVAYYFAPPVLEDIAERLAAALEPGGELLAVHWLGRSPDHRLHADEAHAILGRASALRHDAEARYPFFRVDRWRRA